LKWTIDHGLPIGEIEKAEGVVTAATCGIAIQAPSFFTTQPPRAVAC